MSAETDRERLAKLEQRQDDQADRFRQLWPLVELFGRLDERLAGQDKKLDALTERCEGIEKDAKAARTASEGRKDNKRNYNLAMVAAAISAITLLFFILASTGVFG